MRLPLAKFLALGLLLFTPLCSGAQAETAAIVPISRVPGDAANSDFPSVKVSGIPVETCSTEMNVGYAHFAIGGPVRVEVTAREPIRSFDLSPHRLGIGATVQDNKLTFLLPKPAKLHLKVNDLPRFFLFADPLVPKGPKESQPGTFSLSDFGVYSSPDLVQTAAIQKAIDTVAARRGTLLVPPGIYLTGELRMKSNLSVSFSPCAVLKGTGKLADYPAGEFGTQLIYFQDCENVRIFGSGVIDGQGIALRKSTANAKASRLKLLRSLRARNITIEGVILRDSGTWGAHLIESDDLHFNNCKLISATKADLPDFPWELNTDGFDPDNSSRVLIENCFVSSNDDSIAVKLRYGKRRDMSDVVFRNNVVWTVKSALKIGSEVYDRSLSNIRFENNDVIRADRGIVLSAYCGATLENITWLGNHFEFIGGDIKPMNLEIKIQVEEGKSKIRDILLKDNIFEGAAAKASRLQGLDAEHDISGVTFENLVIGGKKALTAQDANLEVKRFVSGVAFR